MLWRRRERSPSCEASSRKRLGESPRTISNNFLDSLRPYKRYCVLDEPILTRREALRAMGVLAGGVMINAACKRRVRPYVIDPPVGIGRNPRHFTPVNVARDRVIRTVVG